MPAMGGTPCWLPSDGVPDAWDEGELLPDPPDLEEGQAFVHRLGLSGGREEFVTRADVAADFLGLRVWRFGCAAQVR